MSKDTNIGNELDMLDAESSELVDLYGGDADANLFENLDVGSVAEKPKKERSERFWLILALACLFLAVFIRLGLTPVIESQEQRVILADRISGEVQLSGSSATEALSAEGQFDLVTQNVANLSRDMQQFLQPKALEGKAANIIFQNDSASATLNTAWQDYQQNAKVFLSEQSAITDLKTKLGQLNNDISASSNDVVSFVHAVATEGRSQRSAKAKDRYLFLTSEASDLSGILSRLGVGMRGYFMLDEDPARLSDKQNQLVVRLKEMLARITGNADSVVATAAQVLVPQFDQIGTKLLEVSDSANALKLSRKSLRDFYRHGASIDSAIDSAANQSSLLTLMAALNNILTLILLIIGVITLMRFLRLQNRKLYESEGTLSVALAEQQESILKLLDEMSALADGDLTVEAEVTDQITGAIADSVNFAVIEMRELVSQINRASVEVANESELAVSNAQAVSLSNMQQADQITTAAGEMQRVTASMREMSKQALSSAEMASESIEVATQGAQAVRDTIKSMDSMRDQIQETSKRIKRLGESSQRIGDIVALIDDIAEQTNILSLNAAIQASMAGEAGRGFAVVSDEVQSLAERSTEATKKIAELVTTIQNDTNDAMSSMEKAIQQVVSGTKIADSAGGALAEIETVSQRLSSLVETIAQRATRQAQVVTDVAQKVTTVSDSSADTSRKAQNSANSIAKLLELAKELETSVSRFKLPVS